MNRRDALLAILAMPSGTAGVMEQQDKNGTNANWCFTSGIRYVVSLADADEAAKSGGVYELEINYKGQQIKFSAKEIWDALKQPTGFSFF